uniref:[heparan sulfate]-glucosamine N-sulfotransferase n=1 Tax=Timema bartmani TaxID=61472 RepID=A0A7R9I1I9_9NEOP|nr:unnamed protein product [Timema bartmani]
MHRDSVPKPLVQCSVSNGNAGPHDHRSDARLRLDPRVLVFVETSYSHLGAKISELMVHTRIKYKAEVSGKSLPVLTNLDKGKYGVIVFENFNKYTQMDKWNRELLDKYCREYNVGIVGFVPPSEETLVGAQLHGFPLFIHNNLKLKNAALNAASPILRLTRAGETVWGPLPGGDWTVFSSNDSTYEPLSWATHIGEDLTMSEELKKPLSTVIQDHGLFDGIQRILFGSGLEFWLHNLLFLDSLSYLSHGQLSLSLDRYLLVDIDDIFVGERGLRLRTDDVAALLATQKRIQQVMPGKYFHHGLPEENLGDDMLLENAGSFMWFSHMWNHQQPHLYDNVTLLEMEMVLNKQFADEHGIPVDSGYSIAPHHSGVYPVHEILYESWKKVWNVRVTSTEEYPHLRPARLRKGFVHRNIMVLPRQTCGLFTHTIMIEKYPGGRNKLDESIQGVPKNGSGRYLFEKSATYFDGDVVPRRVHALLPHAKLITILISPAKRAYSWYQHTRAHGNQLALNYTFHQVITASDTSPKPLRELRNRCLNPGKYSQHLDRWLLYYPPQNLHIIDGEQLKLNPVDTMNDLQQYLKIQPPFNYTTHLRYDPKKGFYCQVVNGNHTKCLGRIDRIF